MLKVQEYLLTHTLLDLEKEHGVYTRFSTKNHKKFSLTYDQIEARNGDPIAEECRGLVLELDEDSDVQVGTKIVGPTQVLAFPFTRFYNYGQECAANIDWDASVFFEKLDGTLCIVYYDFTLCVWSVATRSVPDADLPLESGKTFADLFRQAAIETYIQEYCGFLARLNKNYTYMFELCTPENEIVVRHTGYKIWLLGMRHNQTGQEVFPEQYDEIFSVCPSIKLSFAQMLDFVAERDPSKYEGLVIRDHNFNRVKVKNPAYVAMSKIRDRLAKSPRAFLELILMEKDDDVYPLLSEEFQDRLDVIKEKFFAWRMMLQHNAMFFGPEVSRKEAALRIQELKLPMGPMMNILFKDGRTTTWIESHKNKDGSFPDKFLDNLLKMIEG